MRVAKNKQYELYLGSCLDELKRLPDESVDSVVSDPPYELGFMGKKWDASGIAYNVKVWKECLRVLKPGGHLLAFGGTRTYHRMAVAIEDAGFEIRDSIHWTYGTGFPKSLNVGKALTKMKSSEAKQWDGWGTALKPSHEPIVVARKPLEGTVAENVLEYGTGALNIDGTRVGMSDEDRDAARVPQARLLSGISGAGRPHSRNGERFEPAHAGRWTANTVLTHSAGCQATSTAYDCATGCPVAEMDGQSEGAARFFTTTEWDPELDDITPFLYVAKPSKKERNAGLDDSNFHPTVKPVALMRHLVRLTTPPGGTVLDPFTGSGTTGVAAIQEGAYFIGIELTKEYLPIIKGRLKATKNKVPKKAA